MRNLELETACLEALQAFRDGLEERAEIVGHMARTLFVSAYADGVEAGEIDGDAAGSGEDWFDVAPDTVPDECTEQAEYIALSIERLNGSTLPDLFTTYHDATGCEAHRFGSALAMRAIGRGVAPSDDARYGSGYADPECQSFEWSYFNLECTWDAISQG